MASFNVLKNGNVRAFVCMNGVRDSKTLATKAKAKSWAREREEELSKLGGVVDDKRTLGDLFERYANDVSSKKAGARWEQIRLTMFQRRYADTCEIKLTKLRREDIEDWVTLRSESVKSSTINRELNLFSHALTWGRRWRWLSHNPMEDLERPKNPKARFRPITDAEINEMLHVLGYCEGAIPVLKREYVALAFLFALETAMRAGEICSLTRFDVYIDKRVAHLKKTKNGDERWVPLSQRAIELIQPLVDAATDESPLFQLTSGNLSANFRKYRLRTTIENLTFHDTRHEAITRLADQFNVLELASISGHRNIKELQTYYNKTAEELALQFDPSKVRKTVTTETMDPDVTQLMQKVLQELSKSGFPQLQAS